MKLSKFAVTVAMLMASLVSAMGVTIPQILQVGAEELLPGTGRFPTIAADSKNQPHICYDGGSYAYFYDKVGAGWQATAVNVGNFGSSQYYNPHVEIDSNDIGWYSGILFGSLENCGIGMFTRTSMSTAPGAPNFSRKHVDPTSWDTGNASVDISLNRCTAFSSGGYTETYVYDGSVPGGSKSVDRGMLFAGRGGEANSIYISKADPVFHPGSGGGTHAIQHTATVGAPGYDSCMYQNSLRQAQGLPPLPWLRPIVYGLGGDGVYAGITADSKDGRIAYVALDAAAHGGQGIWANVYNGTAFVANQDAVISIDPVGQSNFRYAPSMCPAKNGGAFIVYSVSSRVKIRYIAQDGTLGPIVDICPGYNAALCTDKQGNIHLTYLNGSPRYRKLTVSGSVDTTTKACDFDGDGKDDIATFNSSTATWKYQRSIDDEIVSIVFGTQGDVPVPGNYIGDNKAEIAVYRPSDSTWYIRGTPAGIPFGSSALNDVPVPADYNGDGTNEIAVFRPSTATWYVQGAPAGVVFGSEGDTPIPADYDGNGTDEFALFRAANSTWYIAGLPAGIQFGTDGDLPVAEDYDGDGKVDLAVFRAGNGTWYIRGSTGTNTTKQMGSASDLPVPGFYDGDVRCDMALFRPGTAEWFILKSTSGNSNLVVGAPVAFGGAGDIPVRGDFDNDDTHDFAIFRPSTATWYPFGSTAGPMQPFVFGANGDIPTLSDYDGDGTNDIGVFRPSTATWYYWGSKVGGKAFVFGGIGDLPAPADYDYDGKDDIAVFRPSTATWYIWGSKSNGMAYVFGAPGDLPAPHDFDNDGKDDLGLFRPSTGTWYWWGSTKVPGSRIFGPGGSSPVNGDFNDGDALMDFAVYEGGTYGKWWIRNSVDGTLMKGSAPFVFGSPSDMPIGSRRGM